MTRVMWDALYPDSIGATPTADVLIAAYLGHASNPESFAQAVVKYPGHQIVSIASHNAVDAQILDVENGAVDPGDFATINGWLARQLGRSVTPTIYCNTSTWPRVLPGLTHPAQWWAANWDDGPTIPTGAAGVQYAHPATYDVSVMSNAWVALLTPADPPAPPQPSPAAPPTYTVAAGDTLTAIGARFGVTVGQLAAWNNIGNVNLIHPGDVLQLHGGIAVPPTAPTYTVRSGDTLTSIAARYPSPTITWQSIAALNHLTNPNLIHPGDILLIG